jgi:hypothetical protein
MIAVTKMMLKNRLSDKQCDVTKQDGNNNDNRKNTTKQQTTATLPWQPDSNFIKWLQIRQSDIGTPKVALIDIVEGVYLNKFYMYKLRFATRAHVNGWVPQFIVLQYWSKHKLDSWNSSNVDSLIVQAIKPTATEEALAEFPVVLKWLRYLMYKMVSNGLRAPLQDMILLRNGTEYYMKMATQKSILAQSLSNLSLTISSSI